MNKIVTGIFKVKIGLSSELMADIFGSIEKPYSLRINLQFRSGYPNEKIWLSNRTIWHKSFFKLM